MLCNIWLLKEDQVCTCYLWHVLLYGVSVREAREERGRVLHVLHAHHELVGNVMHGVAVLECPVNEELE